MKESETASSWKKLFNKEAIVSGTTSSERTAIMGFYTLFIIVILLGMLATGGVNSISLAFRDMYEDKLTPERDLGQMMEYLFENRLMVEESIATEVAAISPFTHFEAIQANNEKIDSLFNKYVNTHHFSFQEKSDLKEFKTAFNQYHKIENRILKNIREQNHNAALSVFRNESYVPFQAAINPLDKLEKDILENAQQEYKLARSESKAVTISLYISMGIAVALGFIVGIKLSRNYLAND